MKSFDIFTDAQTNYLPSRSNPEMGKYAFSYAITIRNDGQEPVRLLRRHWWVHSDNGQHQEVQGEGVVGNQPHLAPGEEFQYTSWVILETTSGHMLGQFYFVTDEGDGSWEEVTPFFFQGPGEKVMH